MNGKISEAKSALRKVITKSRVHFYKPIQIAEILYRDRIYGDIDLKDIGTYRIYSKNWRDEVTEVLVGRSSTSSAKFQDNLFEENALPPRLISELGFENRKSNGSIEQYIYSQFVRKMSGIDDVLYYANSTNYSNFSLSEFLSKFASKPGLRRSLDKVYEIVVFSLFTSIMDEMGVEIEISVKDLHNEIFSEFSDFTEKIFGKKFPNIGQKYPARLFRMGVTNAADRGLDMWGNFGVAIPIRHLRLSEEVVDSISHEITADRIIIVCKDVEERVIFSLISQLGWRGRIQAIVTQAELDRWYEKAMRGDYSIFLGQNILDMIVKQLGMEFPSISQNSKVVEFFETRGYKDLRNANM